MTQLSLEDELATWNGLRPGDRVKVKGERGEFTFHHATHSPRMTHRLDGRPVSGWSVTVTGGFNTTEWRSFYAEDVSAATTKTRKAKTPRPTRAQIVSSQKPPNQCKMCHEEFPNTGKRGRQPSLCPSCKEL